MAWIIADAAESSKGSVTASTESAPQIPTVCSRCWLACGFARHLGAMIRRCDPSRFQKRSTVGSGPWWLARWPCV